MDVYEVYEGLFMSGSLTDSLSILTGPEPFSVVVDLEGAVDSPIANYAAPAGSLVYVWWAIEDGPMPEPLVVRHLAQLLASLLRDKRKVLVHCSAGLNRSGLLVGRTLLELGLAPSDAVALIRKRRDPNALSNQQFVEWLLRER